MSQDTLNSGGTAAGTSLRGVPETEDSRFTLWVSGHGSQVPRASSNPPQLPRAPWWLQLVEHVPVLCYLDPKVQQGRGGPLGSRASSVAIDLKASLSMSLFSDCHRRGSQHLPCPQFQVQNGASGWMSQERSRPCLRASLPNELCSSELKVA